MIYDYFKYLDEMEEIALIEEPDSTIKYTNKAFSACFGIKVEEAVGKKLLDFIIPEDRENCNMEFIVTTESPSYKVYGRSRRADGKIIWIQYVGRGCFDNNGKLVEFQELAVDITEFKENIEDKVKTLEKANNRINELTKIKDLHGAVSAANKSNIFNNVAAYNFSDIVRASLKMEKAIEQAKSAAERDAFILIEGESGTGKELFAQSIHNYSKRANGPFVAINCGAIPSELIESELFGYTEGAFTGATRHGKQGKFELASWGTLFLDEVAEMPLAQQAVLLRVLETKTVTRVGGLEQIPIDVRIICATNKNLKEEVAKGNFREDLFFRLNVFNIRIPPLRERREDVLELIEVFIKELGSNDFDKSLFYDKQLVKLFEYDWPGNVRELRNVIERVVCIPGYDTNELMETAPHGLGSEEQRRIIEYLDQCGGNVSEVARRMEISRKTLYKKINKYHLKGKGNNG